ncbi:MAG: thiamine diphosphokinase [Actinobacteria bacterium]|nr:thiamine diphosphokinase [Actinomycetota bacterium]
MAYFKKIKKTQATLKTGDAEISNVKTKKALIVANGSIKDPVLTYKRISMLYGFDIDTLVIAADGGAKNCLSMRISPDIVIGDMDSINISIIKKLNVKEKNIKFISTKSEKDESDTQLAVDYAAGRGIKDILIVGAAGDRIDHSLANLLLLSSPVYKGLSIKMLTDDYEIFVSNKSLDITGEPGKLLSIFSLTPFTFFVKTAGLKYRLKNEKLLFSPVRGLSNVFTGKIAKLDISKGTLLLFKEL